MKKEDWAILAFIVSVALIIFVAPLIILWSLNTLFPMLAIPYTWETYIAAAVLNFMINGGSISTKSEK